jgi:hypothetical protein
MGAGEIVRTGGGEDSGSCRRSCGGGVEDKYKWGRNGRRNRAGQIGALVAPNNLFPPEVTCAR